MNDNDDFVLPAGYRDPDDVELARRNFSLAAVMGQRLPVRARKAGESAARIQELQEFADSCALTFARFEKKYPPLTHAQEGVDDHG